MSLAFDFETIQALDFLQKFEFNKLIDLKSKLSTIQLGSTFPADVFQTINSIFEKKRLGKGLSRSTGTIRDEFRTGKPSLIKELVKLAGFIYTYNQNSDLYKSFKLRLVNWIMIHLFNELNVEIKEKTSLSKIIYEEVSDYLTSIRKSEKKNDRKYSENSVFNITDSSPLYSSHSIVTIPRGNDSDNEDNSFVTYSRKRRRVLSEDPILYSLSEVEKTLIIADEWGNMNKISEQSSTMIKSKKKNTNNPFGFFNIKPIELE